jgi:hypothetical protein
MGAATFGAKRDGVFKRAKEFPHTKGADEEAGRDKRVAADEYYG